MKKSFIIVLIIALFFNLCGCSKETQPVTADEVEDVFPAMVYGTWETDPLTALEGAYARCQRTGNSNYIETATGYYYKYDSLLCYADKSDLSKWTPVCPDPDCEHYGSFENTCSARLYTGDFYYSGGRIYYVANSSDKPELYSGKKVGPILCSMAMNGTDHKLEYVIEDAMCSDGGQFGAKVSKSGFLVYNQVIQGDGSYIHSVWLADEEGARQLKSAPGDGAGTLTMFSYPINCIAGEGAIISGLFGGDPYTTVYWEEDGQLQTASIADLPYRNSYFYDGNLRIFRSGDGYYDVDLTTMEEVKLCDAQLEHSSACILQANCVFESTLFFNLTQSFGVSADMSGKDEEPALKFFDGQKWFDVELPEELQNLPREKHLGVCYLSTDCVVFQADIKEGCRTYYRMMLGSDSPKLEYYYDFPTT